MCAHLDLHKVAFEEEAAQLAAEGPGRGEEGQVDGARDEELGQLRRRADADERGNDGAGAGAGDDAREEALLVQGPDHAEVIHAKRRSAREKERGLAEGVPRLGEERQLALHGQLALRGVADDLEEPENHCIVFLNQPLSTDVGVLVKLRVAHAAQTPHER
jgi:hypothetical protein